MSNSMADDASFHFLAQGAILQQFKVAGKNIVLSFPTAAPYLDAPYLGETIGRVANRIRHGHIDNLNGRSYQLATNSGPNHAHGGSSGWGHQTFSGPTPVSRGGREAVRFTYLSPDGEEGYPGTVELRVWYTAWKEEASEASKISLEIDYEVELIGDECQETVINVTNHSYFNIGDQMTIDGTQLIMSTNKYLPLDNAQIPLGHVGRFLSIQPNEPFVLGRNEPTIDHCFVVDEDVADMPLDTRGRALQSLIRAAHATTGIHLEVLSTEPAFQIYTGDYVDVPESEYGPALPPRAGFCCEPGRYIDAVNRPEWRHMVVLKKGQLWGSKIVYKAWKT